MIIALDFGVKLVLHDANGPRPLPKRTRVKGGASISDKFSSVLISLLNEDDVVMESPTIGSSGVEPENVKIIVDAAPHNLYLLTARDVKNYRLDRGIDLSEKNNENDAKILYEIATTQSKHLKLWQDQTERLIRKHTSVRPHDKREYRGPIPDMYMCKLPEFNSLSSELKEVLGTKQKQGNDYSRSKVMPFAMALEEEGADTRDGYERIIGLYGHGYPSFYRRATVVWMQNNAKLMAGVTRMNEVPKEIRKAAWKITRKQIRQLYHMTQTKMGTAYPVKGTRHPIRELEDHMI